MEDQRCRLVCAVSPSVMDQSNPSIPLMMPLLSIGDQGSHLTSFEFAGPLKRSKAHDRDDVEDVDLRLRKRVLAASPVRPEREP